MENVKNVLTASVAAPYLPCMVRFNISDFDRSNDFNCIGINHKDKMLLLEMKYDSVGTIGLKAVDIEYCKLILKPLSEISDEDAIKVAQIADLPEWYRKENWLFDYTNNITIGRGLVNDFYEDYGDPYRIAPKKCNEILKYLRSKLYDCDNLLETGIAIKSDSDGK